MFLFSLISFILLFIINFYFLKRTDYFLLAPLALLSIPFFVVVATKLSFRPVKYIGENSIVFYLVHYLAIQMFAKMIKVSSDSPWINDLKFILVFIVALALPLVVCQLRKRGWLNFLFRLKLKRQPAAPLLMR